jgi:hypothetical protein
MAHPLYIGNGYTHSNRGTVGGGVYCEVCAVIIYEQSGKKNLVVSLKELGAKTN